MMSNGGKNNVSAATKNDESHRYAIVVGGVVYIAGQENTVIQPEPIFSPDHSSKKIELMNDDEDLKLGTKLSLAPPSSFRDDQDLELGTKLSLAPPSSFRSPSPGFIHSPNPPPPPPQLQQPPVPCNNKPYGFFEVLERISLLEKLSNVCSINPSTSYYGDIDEKGTHENVNNDDQREESESDDKEMDLTLKL